LFRFRNKKSLLFDKAGYYALGPYPLWADRYYYWNYLFVSFS